MQLPPGSIIASGPVIIENGKVLLNKEKKPEGVTNWFFPGGEVEDFTISLEGTCKREVKEEMGIEVEIIKPLKTTLGQKPDGRIIVLVHFLAKRIGEIKPGKDIAKWAWHDIFHLPTDCAENVYAVIYDLVPGEDY